MNQITAEILDSVIEWEKIADKIGIVRSEREMMKSAFKIDNV